MTMELSDVSLPVTDDPFLKRDYVLRSTAIHVRVNDLQGRLATMVTKVGKKLERMARLEGWLGEDANLFALSCEIVTQRFFENIYDSAVAAAALRLLEEKGNGRSGPEVDGGNGSNGGVVDGTEGVGDQILGSADDARGTEGGPGTAAEVRDERGSGLLRGDRFDGDDGDLRNS